MGRKTIERGISYDDVKKCYYVLLSTGTDADGKSTKRYETVRTLKEARAIRKEHKKQVVQGRVLPASGDTLAERSEQYIQYKSMQLQATTIYGYNNIIKNHIKPYFKKKKIQDIKESIISLSYPLIQITNGLLRMLINYTSQKILINI